MAPDPAAARQPAERAAEPITSGSDGHPELLVVGRIVAAQGLKGELRVNPLSDFPERFTRPGPRWLQGRTGPARNAMLLQGRNLPGKSLFVIVLEGVNDRESAEALVGHELLVRADDRPPLAEGEFHVLDLVGLEVRLLADGRVLGTVTDLIHGGNDLLEVAMAEEGGRTVLIPFVDAIVPTVELAEGWLGLTPPPGLLDI
jgi:16S rRNA processing protein RimM